MDDIWFASIGMLISYFLGFWIGQQAEKNKVKEPEVKEE